MSNFKDYAYYEFISTSLTISFNGVNLGQIIPDQRKNFYITRQQKTVPTTTYTLNNKQSRLVVVLVRNLHMTRSNNLSNYNKMTLSD